MHIIISFILSAELKPSVFLDDQDAVISDELNHASIIDGIRLCKAKRYRYKYIDLNDLERILKETQSKSIFL